MVRSPSSPKPLQERSNTSGVFSRKMTKKSGLLLMGRALWTLDPLDVCGGKLSSGVCECSGSCMAANQLLWHSTGWCWHETGTRATWWGWCSLSQEKTPVDAGWGAGQGASREQILACCCAERGASLEHATSSPRTCPAGVAVPVGHGQCTQCCWLASAGCLLVRKGFSDSSNIYQLGSSSGAGFVCLSVLPLCLAHRLLLLLGSMSVAWLYNPFGCRSGRLQSVVLVSIEQLWHA